MNTKMNRFALPTQFEINEYDMMETFANEYPDKNISIALSNAINGARAFSRFKNTIHD